jgi:hypothetical protein
MLNILNRSIKNQIMGRSLVAVLFTKEKSCHEPIFDEIIELYKQLHENEIVYIIAIAFHKPRLINKKIYDELFSLCEDPEFVKNKYVEFYEDNSTYCEYFIATEMSYDNFFAKYFNSFPIAKKLLVVVD